MQWHLVNAVEVDAQSIWMDFDDLKHIVSCRFTT